MSKKENTVQPITPVQMNSLRRLQTTEAEEYYPSYTKSKKDKTPVQKKKENVCTVTSEKVDCEI